jgi:hypothetical protein
LNLSALAGCVQRLGSWKTAAFCDHFVIHFSYRKERLKISIEQLGLMENAEVDNRATSDTAFIMENLSHFQAEAAPSLAQAILPHNP